MRWFILNLMRWFMLNSQDVAESLIKLDALADKDLRAGKKPQDPLYVDICVDCKSGTGPNSHLAPMRE